MFRFGMIPTINKPTRVIRQAASAIDHIITNSIMHTGFKAAIIKTDISDSSVKWGHLGHFDPNSTNIILSTNPMGSSGTL